MEKKEIVKSAIIAGVMAMIALIAWIFFGAFSLGDCVIESDVSYQNPNTGASIRIYALGCPLDPTNTTIELMQSSESKPKPIFESIGASDFSAKWEYLDRVVISGNLSNSNNIDLQVIKIDGIKIGYEFTDE